MLEVIEINPIQWGSIASAIEARPESMFAYTRIGGDDSGLMFFFR